MPIYEYECTQCGHKLEVLQKMTESPLVACPHCHAPKLEKIISSAGFRLKGTGWYETDFKTKKNPEEKKQTDNNKSAAPAAVSATTKETSSSTSANSTTATTTTTTAVGSKES